MLGFITKNSIVTCHGDRYISKMLHKYNLYRFIQNLNHLLSIWIVKNLYLIDDWISIELLTRLVAPMTTSSVNKYTKEQ